MTAMHRSSYASPPHRPYRIPRYISGERLREILRDRFGCSPTGERDLYCSFWIHPDGRRFRLLDPIIDPSGSYTVGPDGRWQRVYSIQYAQRLLAYLLGRAGSEPSPERTIEGKIEIDAPAALPYRRLD